MRDGESEKYSVSCNQLAVNNAELQSSEMFIEKETTNNLVAIRNDNLRSKAPCDKYLSSTFQAPSSKVEEGVIFFNKRPRFSEK
ncbi:MAG: hypothetical protein A2033_15515 [Bacteroidetes bacterium GWA2_31_9]|nr:MAG: hypothetical protein A2033_15515 [Bacteroidetes bacterium GWA2_31_9]